MKLNRVKRCQCGCRQMIKENQRFVNGHSSRGDNNPKYIDGRTDKREI
jgi:hypothetical protein